MSTAEIIVAVVFGIPAAIMFFKLAVIFLHGMLALFCEYVDF